MRKLHYNHTYSPRVNGVNRYERADDPSETIQGDAMSIQEMMDRAVKGMPIGMKPVEYMEVDDINAIHKYYRPIVDLTDLDDLKRHADALEEQITAFEKYKSEQDAKDPEKMKIFNKEEGQDLDKPKTED
jgi:hypothetical protein